MINTNDLKSRVIEPILRDAHLYSESAVNLLLGTAAVESHMGTYFMQGGGGPAVGIFQMEPATEHYMVVLGALCSPYKHRSDILFWNLRYAALMCRMHYYRKSEPLPEADDIRALGDYWKKHYNTVKGAGTVDKFVESYKRFVL